VKFEWNGTLSGHAISGIIPAKNKTIATIKLHAQGIDVTKLNAYRTGLFSQSRRITPQDIHAFFEALALLQTTGIPLLQGLQLLADQTEHAALNKILKDLIARVAQGQSLSAALSAYPKNFDRLSTALIDAGERSGTLDVLLMRIVAYQERTTALKAKVKKALSYPVMVLLVSLIVTVVMLTVVVPQFASMFSQNGAALPMPTQVVMGIANGLQKHFFVIISSLTIIACGIFCLNKKSKTFKHALHKQLLNLPLLGRLLQQSSCAKTCETLQTLLQAGIPLHDALTWSARTCTNLYHQQSLRTIAALVSSGRSLHQSFAWQRAFPPLLADTLNVAETTGKLEHVLGQLAKQYQQSVSNTVDQLSQMIEPAVMVFLGCVVGGIVLAMYLPLFQMGQTL
jgi:type IV pilus assembly protein PilC